MKLQPTYCLRCKRKTGHRNPHGKKVDKNHYQLHSDCSTCGRGKASKVGKGLFDVITSLFG